ncbi:MAG: hypothetical protein WCJ30_01810 [Deltaproteobacteria bacterium]
MADVQESALTKKLTEWLEGAFESVALTRRQHFSDKPGLRPRAGDIDELIKSYANQNFVIAGAANLVPGPLGALAIVPEITLVMRNQIQMIYDLGVAHGKEAQLNSRLLLAIFATVSGGGALGIATVKGGQLIVKRASLRVIQQIIVWLGGKITQRALRALLAKWVPLVGAGAMAIWARQTTVAMGREATSLLQKEIIEVAEARA